MNENEKYAEMLELYARIIKQKDYELTEKQKVLIVEMGRSFKKNKMKEKKIRYSRLSKLGRKYRERTRRIKNICKRSRKKSVNKLKERINNGNETF